MRGYETEIRWGILGGGRVVEKKSGAGFLIPGSSRVVAVSRRHVDDAQRTARALGAVKAVTSLEDLVSDSCVDVVYIATPPGLHFGAAELCAQAGKPVYIEKPFVTSTSDAEALVELFNAKDVPLFVAHYKRALPKFQRAKSLIESELGEVISFDFHLSRRLADDIDHPWIFNPELSGGGKFADIAAHSIDLLVHFFGNVTDLWARARHLLAPNGREDCVIMGMELSNGVCGTLNYNFAGTEKGDWLSVHGTRANLHFSIHGEGPLEFERHSGDRTMIEVCSPPLIEGPMIGEVVKALHGDGGNPCTGAAAMETVRVMEFALRQLDA